MIFEVDISLSKSKKVQNLLSQSSSALARALQRCRPPHQNFALLRGFAKEKSLTHHTNLQDPAFVTKDSRHSEHTHIYVGVGWHCGVSTGKRLTLDRLVTTCSR